MKTCRTCNNDYPIEKFAKKKGCIDGRSHTCKNCHNAKRREENKDPEVKAHKYRYNKEWVSKNQDKVKDWYKRNSYANRLKKSYNMSVDDYHALLDSQNKCCAICFKPALAFQKKLYIDHDHKNGKVRGLLCHSCNVALGLFKDSLDNLNSAVEYLKRFNP